MGRYYSHWGAGAYQLFIAGLVDRYTDQRIFKTQVQNFRRLQGKIKSMITVNHLVKTYTGRIVVDIAALQINEGEIIGPRIYPSGAALSQTGGHMDLDSPIDRPRHWGGSGR